MIRDRPLVGTGHISVTSKPNGMNSLEIEQKFIDAFPEKLTREGTILYADFENGIRLAVMKFNLRVAQTHTQIGRVPTVMETIPIRNISEIDYTSGMLLIHRKIGTTIEVDLI